MEGFIIFIYILIIVGQSLFFGFITQRIIENKNYDDNWFWWGFFFGIWAVLVALTKPQRAHVPTKDFTRHSLINTQEDYWNKGNKNESPRDTVWKCSKCGSYNPGYTGTCSCGNSKYEDKKKTAENKSLSQELFPEKNVTTTTLDDEQKIINTIKEYKNLLDSGAITQAEFDNKKQELLAKK